MYAYLVGKDFEVPTSTRGGSVASKWQEAKKHECIRLEYETLGKEYSKQKEYRKSWANLCLRKISMQSGAYRIDERLADEGPLIAESECT